MFGTFANRASAYARVDVETGVSEADPHKLILMLFDGALVAIGTAAIELDSKNVPAKGAAISKAIDIIANGLKSSLDMDAGGELAERLSALYDYMAERLLCANLHNSRAALDEVSGLLRGLRDAWAEIGTRAEATAA